MTLTGSETAEARGQSGSRVWHFLTGEYPPQPGGISDYTELVATALARLGDQVHVWTTATLAETTTPPGVTVHRSAGAWSSADLRRLDAELDRFAAPRCLVVQYTPNAWGHRGMNIGFCRWLHRRRRRGDEVRLMFHEVRYHMEPRDRPIRRVLVVAHNWMARILMKAATHVYVSVPGWTTMLRALAPRSAPTIAWSPVPSNVPAVDDPEGVAGTRRRYAPGSMAVIGTFATFRESTRTALAAVFPPLLRAHADRVGLLIGRNGPAFAEGLIADHPELAGRLFATGGLPPDDIARHLQACDVLIQADPGGVCTKQGTTMAGMLQGRAIVAGIGHNTEPVWSEERCVALAPSVRAADLIAAVESCLADPVERARLGSAAHAAYAKHFSIERTVEVLTGVRAASGDALA
jgi:glycosyltransferase involved in cell wall biosynthesis